MAKHLIVNIHDSPITTYCGRTAKDSPGEGFVASIHYFHIAPDRCDKCEETFTRMHMDKEKSRLIE
jgi:hypothetical protein